jgi:hypothetical protein
MPPKRFELIEPSFSSYEAAVKFTAMMNKSWQLDAPGIRKQVNPPDKDGKCERSWYFTARRPMN